MAATVGGPSTSWGGGYGAGTTTVTTPSAQAPPLAVRDAGEASRVEWQAARCVDSAARRDACVDITAFGRQRDMSIQSETPVLDTLAAMTVDSVERCGLDEATLILTRIAALAAMDAPATSYLAHLGPAVEAGMTVERLQDVLVAVAPIVGTARVMSAAGHITQALGFAIAVADIEVESEA
ncbi:alkylhydroperoxidase/carboxymuconolactone decarboxylase family protein YurZ [Kitasatospora sp. GP30]|nr:alkylhydroperoxidase/carboxymuconolactone decarboxylase family protein YurZ [Kitasatospora sp. GP30]